MVGMTGFEPATPWSQIKCTTKLCYIPQYGAPSRNRTRNLLIRSQTLYPVELWAHIYQPVIRLVYNTKYLSLTQPFFSTFLYFPIDFLPPLLKPLLLITFRRFSHHPLFLFPYSPFIITVNIFLKKRGLPWKKQLSLKCQSSQTISWFLTKRTDWQTATTNKHALIICTSNNVENACIFHHANLIIASFPSAI